MPRERYRLQALLIIKEREKQKAEIALAAAIGELVRERKRMNELVCERDEIVRKWNECRKKMAREMTAGSYIFDGTIHTNYLRGLKEDEEAKEKEIADQEEVIREAEEAVAAARKDYIEASKEFKVMQKHKELWKKKIENEISKKEERELNDLANIVHQLRRMQGEESQGV